MYILTHGFKKICLCNLGRPFTCLYLLYDLPAFLPFTSKNIHLFVSHQQAFRAPPHAFFFAVRRSHCKSSSRAVQIHTDKSSIPTTQQTASQRYESTISIQNINDHIKQISHYYWHVVFNLLNHSFGALACIIVPNHTNEPVSLRIWNQKLWPWVLVQRHCSFL